MRIRISGIVQDSIVDGPGLRTAVFVQGCSHGCPGCHNPDTHDPSGGQEMDTEDILADLMKNPLCAGLTLSGGEPFEQAGPCLSLACGAHALGKNVWTYTGYTLEALQAKEDPYIARLLAETDVLVDGPYLAEQRSLEIKFRGSKNQRLIDMKRTTPGCIVLWQDPWESLES